MAENMTGFLIFAGVLVAVPFLVYNNLVFKRNGVKNSFASIDAMLKKRYDLIPNLIGAVQAFMKHEKELLTHITELRTRAGAPGLDPEAAMELDRQMGKAMSSFRVAVEAYPQLKSNENFLQLQGSLNETEEQISAARRAYNASVMSFNNSVEMFPGRLLAGLFRFEKARMFEAAEEERKNVDVKGMFKA